MRLYLLLSVLALAGLTSGCASVTGSTTQNVSVQSREQMGDNVPGAVCELSNSKGKWYVTTPGTVMIHRSNDDMQVLCNKAGYEAGYASVVSKTKAEMFGNIILGGAIGAVIDHNNGSAYEYPDFIQVLMRAFSRGETPQAESPPASRAGAPVPAIASTLAQAAAGREYPRDERSRAEPLKPATRRIGGNYPEVGDSWTYRFSDGFGKTGNYTVQVKAVSEDEITDELKMGRIRDQITFMPGLGLADRKAGQFSPREISPYLMSLGPVDPNGEWKSVTILPGNEPFTARLAGTEMVQVQAGTFEARKVVFEGRQVFSGSYFYGIPSRAYSVTAWYAPAAKRFVKLQYSAIGGGQFPPESETIELVETSLELRTAIARPVPQVAPQIEQPAGDKSIARRDSGPNPQVGDSWTYRFSDSFGKSGTYTVQVKAVSEGEITDELKMGRARDSRTFTPGLGLTDRKSGEISLREISPYLMTLGPTNPTAEWKSLNILAGAQPFTARLAGFETVQVMAGTFETRKVVIEGRQTSGAAYFAGLASRPYTITVWYAPVAKRFVKLQFSATGGGQFSSEQETIELIETNFDTRVARNQTAPGGM